jgi:hypothetical protein
VEDNFFAIIEMRTANMALVPPLITEHIIITTSNNLCSERIKQNINFCWVESFLISTCSFLGIELNWIANKSSMSFSLFIIDFLDEVLRALFFNIYLLKKLFSFI